MEKRGTWISKSKSAGRELATVKRAARQRAIQFLKGDSQARIYFINKIAAPIANKLFDCGMIP